MNSKDFYRFWNYIETRAFSPKSEKEVEKWLSNFTQFFDRIYEKGEKWVNMKPENNKFIYELKFEPVNIYCKYCIEIDLSKFSFDIKLNGSAVQFGYDRRYVCEFDYLDDHCKKEEISNEFTREELEEILKNKIKHPALHYHIKKEVPDKTQDKKKDFPHDIRITAAIKNPFLFLYQLSFQILLILEKSQKQQDELKRLTKVILENKDRMTIRPGKLFDI
jgi:hypothetical protein